MRSSPSSRHQPAKRQAPINDSSNESVMDGANEGRKIRVAGKSSTEAAPTAGRQPPRDAPQRRTRPAVRGTRTLAAMFHLSVWERTTLLVSAALILVMGIMWVLAVISVIGQVVVPIVGFIRDDPMRAVEIAAPPVAGILFARSQWAGRLYEATIWSRTKKSSERGSWLERVLSSDSNLADSRRACSDNLRPHRGFAFALATVWLFWVVTLFMSRQGDAGATILSQFFGIVFVVGAVAAIVAISGASGSRLKRLPDWLPLVIAATGFGFGGAFVGGQIYDSLPSTVRDNFDLAGGIGMTAKTSLEVFLGLPGACYGIWHALVKHSKEEVTEVVEQPLVRRTRRIRAWVLPRTVRSRSTSRTIH
jgi:hypothetical protein